MDKTKQKPNDSILEIAKQISNDMETLRELTYKLFEKNLGLMSEKSMPFQEKSQKIARSAKPIIFKIIRNIRKLTHSLRSTPKYQVTALEKSELDDTLIDIMKNYHLTSNRLQREISELGIQYPFRINKIHYYLNKFSEAIETYNNGIATRNNLPKNLTTNDALTRAKQEIRDEAQ